MASSSSSVLAPVVVFLVIVMVSHAQAATQHAPAPAVDCSSLILNMADCLSYVSNGSTVAKPEGTCCTGLKTVLKADAACLCEAFKSSAQLGVVLNVTKAATLPAACKVSAPSATNCGLSVTPSGAPALSPSDQITTPTISVPAPDSGNVNAPSPTPGSSGGTAAFSVSVGSMVAALVVASFSSF